MHMVIDRAKRVIVDLLQLDADADETVRLKEDLGVDSLAMVDLIIDLEDRLGVEFSDAELDPSLLVSLGDLYGIASRRLSVDQRI